MKRTKSASLLPTIFDPLSGVPDDQVANRPGPIRNDNASPESIEALKLIGVGITCLIIGIIVFNNARSRH